MIFTLARLYNFSTLNQDCAVGKGRVGKLAYLGIHLSSKETDICRGIYQYEPVPDLLRPSSVSFIQQFAMSVNNTMYFIPSMNYLL